ncbi:MAG TPA: Yip1 family protein, partial [Pyrinomonadaceae bacterium]|nr:Yip1 family protein [Pyrinomonadaceae bacterium]
MNEENQDQTSEFQNVHQPNNTEWQAQPIPEQILKTDEQPQMSEVGTLGGIFFEPGKTFEDLRRKPRFLLAGLIILVLVTVFNFLFINKIGFEEITRARMESSERFQQLPADQKQAQIEFATTPVLKYITYAALPIGLIISFLIGGLIYWLGANAMGGSATFLRGVSVWIYSSFPPTVVSMLA